MVETICQETFLIPNPLGLHTRASSKLCDCACRFLSHITLQCGNRQANAKRIMEVMTLGAGHDHTLVITIEGPDAQEAMTAMSILVQSGFGEL